MGRGVIKTIDDMVMKHKQIDELAAQAFTQNLEKQKKIIKELWWPTILCINSIVS